MLAVKKKLGEHWAPEGGIVVDSDGQYLKTMVYWERSEEDKQKSKDEANRISAKMFENLPSELLDKIESRES